MNDNRERQYKRAVIFGSSGAIGHAVCHQLSDRDVDVWAGSRSNNNFDVPYVRTFQFDLEDEASIAAAAKSMKSTPPDLVFVATGVLTLKNGEGPERTFKRLEPGMMVKNFALNTIGPALIAKHFLPILPRDRRAIFSCLSARVGSISDNGLGGWHSYRASKAALNMLLKNFALELSRTHKLAIVAGLHPGTVDSDLSRPFQKNLPEGQLTKAKDAAKNLLDVIDGLEPADTGKIFDFAGQEIAP